MTRVNGNSERFGIRLLLTIITILVAVLTMFGCSAKNDEAAFVLAEMDNPFIGKWQSDIPSANTTLIFDYKPDGTFDYEMAGVPAEQGGVGTGGYAVYDGVMVTWLQKSSKIFRPAVSTFFLSAVRSFFRPAVSTFFLITVCGLPPPQHALLHWGRQPIRVGGSEVGCRQVFSAAQC